MIREKALQLTREEVPHAVSVEIDEIADGRVRAFVVVETESQKGILVGKRGATIREIGTRARPEVDALLGRTVYLELVVKVRPTWRRDPRQLERFGLSRAQTPPEKVSQAAGSPLSKPFLNQLVRCSEEAVRPRLAVDAPSCLLLDPIVADCGSCREPSSRSPCSSSPCAYAVWPHTPARQSAWSSIRICSSFARSGFACCSACTSRATPITFWTWWPNSCAITYACAKSPGAPNRCDSSRKKPMSR